MTLNVELFDGLLQFLQAETGQPELAYARPPQPMSGGFWADLYSFSLSSPPPGWSTELVARFMPDGALAVKETIVQQAVADAGYPTPAVRASGGPAVVGRAFMVMDRAGGEHFLSGLNGAKALTSSLPLLRHIPEVLAEAMSRLHALDPQPVQSRLSSVHDVPTTAVGLLEGLRSAASAYRRTDLVDAAEWLLVHPSSASPDVICHGDLHPFNLLSDHGRVTVLDWSAALVAPAAYDLAFTSMLVAQAPVSVPTSVRPFARALGRTLARRFVHRYEHHVRTPIAPSELDWHKGLVALRCLVEVAGWEASGVIETRSGHPWLLLGPAFADRLGSLTESNVAFR